MESSHWEWERRENIRFSSRIRSEQIFDPVALRVIATGLRDLGRHDPLKQFWAPGVEHMAMDLIAESVHFGAFMGPQWIVWRAEVAADPNIYNAIKNLKCPPSPYLGYDAESNVSDHVENTRNAVFFLANLVDHFAKQSPIEQAAPSPILAKKPGRKKGSLKSKPNDDAKLYADWKSSDLRMAEFASGRGFPMEDVKAAVNRHKRRKSVKK